MLSLTGRATAAQPRVSKRATVKTHKILGKQLVG